IYVRDEARERSDKLPWLLAPPLGDPTEPKDSYDAEKGTEQKEIGPRPIFGIGAEGVQFVQGKQEGNNGGYTGFAC
ncbi:MAG: hypothetical protein WA854_13600, partial [Candidatus Binataceae bacterium]